MANQGKLQRQHICGKGERYSVSDRENVRGAGKRYHADALSQSVYNLQPGDELCIPAFTAVISGAFVPYVVKKGDTVLGIAKSNKTTVENLAKSNKKIRELTLPVGTVLLIDKAK